MLTILVFEINEGKNAKKIKKLLTIIFYLYLAVEKRNNLNRFCQTRTKDKAYNYLWMSNVLLCTSILAIWPLKIKRNCIVDKSLAVRIVDIPCTI
jgi:hypothetical protein